MAIKYRWFTPIENLKRAKRQYKLAVKAESILEQYPLHELFGVSNHDDVTAVELPNDWTVEQCWDFVGWLEDQLDIETEKNRAIRQYDDKFFYSMKYDGIDFHINNVKEFCKIVTEKVLVPEKLVPEHYEEVFKIVCADQMEV